MKSETKAVFWEICFWLAVIALAALCFGCDGPVRIEGRPSKSGPVAPNECPDGQCPGLPPLAASDCPRPSGPPMDLPAELRESNYKGGSCMHASLISVLRWQGRFTLADWWRKNQWGAASVYDLARVCRRHDVDFAWVTNGDAAFLDWCSETKRGAAIHYFSQHAVTFCGYEKDAAGREVAVLIDNNRTGVYVRVPKSQFIPRWRGYGGFALTVVYAPTPPRPWK